MKVTLLGGFCVTGDGRVAVGEEGGSSGVRSDVVDAIAEGAMAVDKQLTVSFYYNVSLSYQRLYRRHHHPHR